MFINPKFTTMKIRHFLRDLVYSYDYKSYDDLGFDDKAEFTALLIEACDPNSEHECFLESNNLDQIMNHFRIALTGNREDNQAFLDVIKQSAINYYEPFMEALFNEFYDDEKCEPMTVNLNQDWRYLI